MMMLVNADGQGDNSCLNFDEQMSTDVNRCQQMSTDVNRCQGFVTGLIVEYSHGESLIVGNNGSD